MSRQVPRRKAWKMGGAGEDREWEQKGEKGGRGNAKGDETRSMKDFFIFFYIFDSIEPSQNLHTLTLYFRGWFSSSNNLPAGPPPLSSPLLSIIWGLNYLNLWDERNPHHTHHTSPILSSNPILSPPPPSYLILFCFFSGCFSPGKMKRLAVSFHPPLED